MRTSLYITIVATVAMALASSDALGRPGRGGGGGARPGGAAGGGSRPGGTQPGNRPTGGGPKINSPGGKFGGNPGGKLGGGQSNAGPGGFNKNPGGKFNDNGQGQFGKGAVSGQRPTNQQLQDFLGKNADAVKSGDFQRGDNAQQHTAQSKEQFQAQASQLQSNVQGRADDLFTPQWYAQHPNAWQATHPHADAWAVATAASVAAWVGTAAYGGGSDTVIVESGNTGEATEATEEPADSGDTAATGPQNFTSTNEANDPTQWLALGVFALAQDGQTEPTTLIQLSVNKQGQLNGSYYDLVSDSGTPVGGQLDAGTQRAAWTVGENSKNVFTTSVETLTGDSGPVALHLSNGKTQDWNLIRLKQPEPKPTSPNSR
ncbi:MAG: hypothetical protein WD875_02225 [Pirellulales bacterium]